MDRFINRLKILYASVLLLSSALFGIIILIPFLLMTCIFTSKQFFVQVFDIVLGSWFSIIPAIVEFIFGINIFIFGDKIDKSKNSLILLNHRCQLDWFYFSSVAIRFGFINQYKIVLKEPLKYLPGAGWAMQTGIFLFLKRIYQNDIRYIEKWCKFVKKYRKRIQLLIFPEGTDFCEKTLESSNRYALKNGLSLYRYVLYPRVNGTIAILDYLQIDKFNKTLLDPIKQIHDITVAYDDTNSISWSDLATGRLPKAIYFFIKTHNITDCYDSSCVESTHNNASNLINKIWQDKEIFLQYFYTNKKEAIRTKNLLNLSNPIKSIILSFLFWNFVVLFTVKLMYLSNIFLYFIIIEIIIVWLINKFYNIDEIILIE